MLITFAAAWAISGLAVTSDPSGAAAQIGTDKYLTDIGYALYASPLKWVVMFAPLAFTKTYAMAASAGLAISVVPVLMGYTIRGKVISEHKNPVNKGLIALYMPALKTVLRYPKSTVLVALMVTVVGFYPLNDIGSEFMPPLDEGDLMYMPTTYAGISVGKAREVLQQTDKLIRSVPEVKNVFGKIGRADTATDPAPLTMIETFIQFKPQDEWRPGMTKADIRAVSYTHLTLPTTPYV